MPVAQFLCHQFLRKYLFYKFLNTTYRPSMPCERRNLLDKKRLDIAVFENKHQHLYSIDKNLLCQYPLHKWIRKLHWQRSLF